MAKIYSTPKEVQVPEISFTDFSGYQKKCEEFKENLKEFLKKRNSKDEEVGEVIGFPVADGTAEYMVAKMKPLELVHLPLMDAYEFQYANRLTAEDVKQEIAKKKKWEEFINRKKG